MSTIGNQETSAYQARLFGDEEAVVLVTQTGFTVFRNGEAPEQHAVPLGTVAVRQGASLVFWRSGMLRQISLDGEDERGLAALAHAPQFLLASQSRLAWIDLDQKAGASLHTLSGGQVRRVHAVEERVCAASLRDSRVYWILQSRDGSWTIASIDLDGRHQTQTAAHQGRAPAMLALGPDGVYFYDGPERGVRRLSFDLDREDAILNNVICSPVFVSHHAICAQVGGLFDIPSPGTAPRYLATERAGPVTALAATDDRLFWVAESGADQLVVRTLPLPGH